MMWLRILFGIAIAIGLFVWIAQLNPLNVSASGPVSVSLAPLQASALAAKSSVLGDFEEDGVIIYDTSAGNPGTPYIEYETTKSQVATKELIFNTDRGCETEAGDIPCLPQVGQTSSTPGEDPLPAGTPIHVSGGAADQAVFVNSYEQIPLPSGMVVFTTNANQPTQLTNGVSVLVQGIADDASCSFGVGCFGNGVDRVATTFSSGQSIEKPELVPGVLYQFGDTTFTVISVSGSGNSLQVTFLAALNK